MVTIYELLDALSLLDVADAEFGMNYNDEMDEWSCNYCTSPELFDNGCVGIPVEEIPHTNDCPLIAMKKLYVQTHWR